MRWAPVFPSRLRARPIRWKECAHTVSDPSISFIVPAWNEEALLPRALESIRHAAKELAIPFEILVVDDNSTDRTAAIAREFGVHVVPVNCRQIAAVRNAGAKAARGNVFFFIDADTAVDEAVLRSALDKLDRGFVGGGAGFSFDGAVPLYARILEHLTRWGARKLALASGCFVFCRRADFEAVGGFDETLFAAEEWAISNALKRRGRFLVLRERVLTSGRKVRAYRAREILGTLLAIGLRGRRALGQRDGLSIWYGTRRAEQPDRSQSV
jgi:glycosyltransferase involved in cell wall biosynthesis